MLSKTVWKLAPAPNYSTNVDLAYPYSELPYLGDYNVIKIPISLNNLIHHVDYWGEGRVQSSGGISGFPNVYNVNHQYKLVSSGSDKDRKIPNRIPVISDTEYDTSGYIKDSSVITVTVSGSINSSCAKDIARIVNNDIGKVVAFGFNSESSEIAYLSQELLKKGLFYCPSVLLPSELQGLTLYKEHVIFVNLSTIKEELSKSITTGAYDVAVILSKALNNEQGRDVLEEIVTKFINTKTIMNYAYKLWHDGGKSIVQNYFPAPFALIYNEDYVKIINKGYNLALKLGEWVDRYNDRLVWGDASDKSSRNVCWKFIPIWENNAVTFKIYNVHRDMYVKLDVTDDNIGDRRAWGSKNSGELRHRYYLEPLMCNGTIVFFIINRMYEQYLKMAVSTDSYNDRGLWGHNGTLPDEERFRWIINAWDLN